MTDFTESHGPQGGDPTSTLGRRLWKTPRLIDLDDDNAEGMVGNMGIAGSKLPGDEEGRAYTPIPGGQASIDVSPS